MRERSSRPGRKYAAIPNDAMRDKRLSAEARGTLALLMTYSDDWLFRRDHLMDMLGMGREKFQRVMKELSDTGYVSLTPIRGDGGHMEGTTWVINDDPTESLKTRLSADSLKNRQPVEPTAGETDPLRIPKGKKTKREENQESRASAAREVLPILSEVLSEGVACDFIAHRKALRKPLTPRAAELIVGRLRECRDPDAVANASIMNGWQGVFPEREQAGAKPGPAPGGYDAQADRWAYIARHGTSEGWRRQA